MAGGGPGSPASLTGARIDGPQSVIVENPRGSLENQGQSTDMAAYVQLAENGRARNRTPENGDGFIYLDVLRCD